MAEEKKVSAMVPATAILHLHDRDWVYEPAGEKSFRRVEVSAASCCLRICRRSRESIAGDRVVKDALMLQNSSEAVTEYDPWVSRFRAQQPLPGNSWAVLLLAGLGRDFVPQSSRRSLSRRCQ
jgi:hypothetical protein